MKPHKTFILTLFLLFTFAIVPSASAALTGIEGAWSFDGDSILDVSGNGRDWNDINTTELVNGVINEGRESGGIGVGEELNQNWDTSSWTEYTIAMMVYVDSTAVSREAWSRQKTGTDVSRVRVHDDNTFRFQQGNGTMTVQAPPIGFTNGRWYCVVTSAREGDNLTIYVNGTESSIAAPINFGTPDVVMEVLRHDGKMDELVISTDYWDTGMADEYCAAVAAGQQYPYTGNTAPVVTTPTPSPVSPTEDQDITWSVTYTDAEEDAGTVRFEHSVEGVNVVNETIGVTNGSVAMSTITSGNYSGNETVSVNVVPNDGTTDGTPTMNSVITSIVTPPPPSTVGDVEGATNRAIAVISGLVFILILAFGIISAFGKVDEEYLRFALMMVFAFLAVSLLVVIL